jgi:hypothetical protein
MPDVDSSIDNVVAGARERVALIFGVALLVAGLIFVGAVLPAEFGIDPFGTGRRLGLTALGDVQKNLAAFEASRAGDASGIATVVPQEGRYQDETRAFTVAARDSFEYKYRLEKGQALLYSWSASDLVNYELHAEPDGAPRGYAETYEQATGRRAASGTLTAPFSGIHGWYWENTTDHAVTITLSAAGFFRMSHEFRKDQAPITNTFQQANDSR